jgi:hypothetical protein
MKEPSIVDSPYRFACKWYTPEQFHHSICNAVRNNRTDILPPMPVDVTSVGFALWLTEQCQLAMTKGAELAIAEMRAKDKN